MGLFPQNLAAAWTSNAVVPIIVFAIIVALAYNRLASERQDGEKVDVRPFKAFIDAGNKVLGETVSWVVGFTPYAVVALIGRAVGRADVTQLVPLLGVLAVAYVVLAIQFFGVESAFVAWVGHLSPVRFLKGMAPAAVTAFTTQSSIGTLPVTIRSLTQNLGVDEDVASFTAGLGANLGMPGCAGMWPTLVAVFAINALGIPFTPVQYGFLVLLTLVVSIGTVGVPGTATITATALLAALGLPVETIALVAPISSIVDMGRTATNVIGAAEASLLGRYGIKTHAVNGRDFCFVNGDENDFRYSNLKIINPYFGVERIDKNRTEHYKVRIHIHGNITVGNYTNAIDAAIAYNKAVDLAHQAGISKNFPENYIEELSASSYADIYQQISLSPTYLSYLKGLPRK